MSIAANETDKQVGAILERIQAVTPEVAEQAVVYYQVMNSVWLVILAVVAVVALIICHRCVKAAICASYVSQGLWNAGAVGTGVVTFSCLLGCAALVNGLVHSLIAPQHYAAECVIELGRKAFGS
jgi:hypothetical protein